MWEELFKKYGINSPTCTDPFAYLASEAMRYKSEGLPTVRMTCSPTGGTDYGQVKLNFSMTIECPQTDAHIMMAGEACFCRAKQLLDDGSDDMGIPRA